MTAQTLSSSSPDSARQGWSLSPQEPESVEATRIIAEIDRAISETCVPSNGPLEMTPTGGWTYDMPWHRFPGGKLSNTSPLCVYCSCLFDRVDNTRRTYACEGCEWATGPDAQGVSHVREGALEKKPECHFCRLTFRSLSQNELITLQGGFEVKIDGEPESALVRLTWTYSPRAGTASVPKKFSKSVMLVSTGEASFFILLSQIVGLRRPLALN
jgi:hypothetical protein